MRANAIHPGMVVPSIHEGEWTFTYYIDQRLFTDEDRQGSVTYSSAARAKEAMREKVEQLRTEGM